MTMATVRAVDGAAGSPTRSSAIARGVTAAAALLMFFSAPVSADRDVRVTLQGGSVFDEGFKYETDWEVVRIESNGKSGNLSWLGWASAATSVATSELSVWASITGTSVARAEAEAYSTSIRYVLRPPPAGAKFDAGTIVVYGTASRVDIEGDASLRFALEVEAKLANCTTCLRSDERTIKEQPGEESVELRVPVKLPAALDSTRDIDLAIGTVLVARADIEPAADGSTQASWARAEDSGQILTGFEVFNSAGVQVRGFTMTGSSGLPIPERAPPQEGTARAVEFYYPDEKNFFLTANPEEIARLDGGAIAGWVRTGESFNVYTSHAGGTVGICRFYTDKFLPDFAHFYAAIGPECEAVQKNATWKFEGIVFFMPLPAADGTCPAGHREVFRLYNDAFAGAPSHRLTTRALSRRAMIEEDWIPEGSGPGVSMCSPI